MLEALRQRHVQHSAGSDDEAEDNPPGNSRRHEGWHVSPSNGLDEVLINKIAVCRYKRGDGLVDGTDCSVCLGEFREDESLRLLPKRSHAFHVQCIDTWLKSHSNCPLCPANVVSVTPAPPQLQAPPLVADNPPELEAEHYDEMVVVMAAEESSRGGGEDNELGCECDPPQDNCDHGGSEEEGHYIVEIRDDGIQPCVIQSTMRWNQGSWLPFSVLQIIPNFRSGVISVTMYNFGSPRVGNKRFTEVYNEENMEFLGDGYQADVIGESTPDYLFSEFMKGEKQLVEKILQTEISLLCFFCWRLLPDKQLAEKYLFWKQLSYLVGN